MYYKSVSAIAGGGKTAVLLNTFSKGLARCSGSNWVFFPDPNWLCAPGANKVSGGIDGLRDRAGLEAAIAAPLQSFGGEDLFPTDIEKIARIGFGLASNHAFIDGNKRIGAMVTQLLLKWNGYQFQLEQNELADMFIGIADGTKDETELRYWINDHIE